MNPLSSNNPLAEPGFVNYLKEAGRKTASGVLTTGYVMLVTHLFLSVHPIAGGLIVGASSIAGLVGFSVARLCTRKYSIIHPISMGAAFGGFYAMAKHGLPQFGYPAMTGGQSALYGLKVAGLTALPIALVIGLAAVIAAVASSKKAAA